MQSTFYIDDEQAMQALGESFAKSMTNGMTLHFSGELGAGKTTLIRGVLRGLGYSGAVKSPTFTLVESYTINSNAVYHMDFYRVEDAQELETIGIRDYLDGSGLCLIEWPERANGLLPEPDVKIHIKDQKPGRKVQIEVQNQHAYRFKQYKH